MKSGLVPPKLIGEVNLNSLQSYIDAKEKIDKMLIRVGEPRQRNIPGSGIVSKRTGNKVNEAEYLVRIPKPLPTKPSMMKQIRRDREPNKPRDENANVRRTWGAPKSSVNMTIGSKI